MIHAQQMRAARALLGWYQEDLARKAKVGLATIQRLERGEGILAAHVSTAVKIQTTLERSGIHFITADAEGGIGVRLKR